MSKRIARIAKKDFGVTAVEYGLIASLITIAIIACMSTLGTRASATIVQLVTTVSGVGS